MVYFLKIKGLVTLLSLSTRWQTADARFTPLSQISGWCGSAEGSEKLI